VALVIAGTGGAIAIANVALPVPVALVALNVTADAPAAVGVPEITPVLVLTFKPGGNPLAP
jgi:hypothetical protein